MSALLAREQLATGTLVRVVPAWAGAGMRVSAVLPSRHHRTPRVQRFVDLLASHAATVLD
jgi:DNA-binding transcriptional LysR family regulator